MFATLAIAALGAMAPAPETGKIVSASLFKNGYAAVVREVPLDADGETLVGSPPMGALGTVWLSASDGVKIQSAIYTSTETSGTRDVANLDELLAANVGRNVTIDLRRGDTGSQTLSGKLLSAQGPMFVIQVEAGRVAAFKSEIRLVLGQGGDLVYTTETKTRQPVIRVRAQSPRGGKLYTIALQRGLTWAPGYQVDTSDEAKLALTGKATILNDLGDLDGIEIRLVTGFPNLPYLSMWDPFTSGMSVDQFVNSMMSVGMDMAPGSAGGPMTQNALRAGSGDVFTPFQPSTLEGLQLEDLFFYRLPDVTLKPGERGYYVLFQAESDYRHVYTLDIGNRFWPGPTIPGLRMPDLGPDGRLAPLDVWHTLRFPNTAGMPLTTGPATIVQDGELLGQDLLNYTSPNAEATVRITKALDVRAEDEEVEKSRERGAITVNGVARYDLVTLEGTIQVTNRKAKAVDMRIEKTVVGEATLASDRGVITRLAGGLVDVNGSSRIVWAPTIQSGGTLRLTYTYRIYVPV